MINKVIILRALPWGSDSRVERWAKIYSNNKPLFGVWGNQKSENIQTITNIKRKPSSKLFIGIGYLWFTFASFFFVLRNASKNDVVVFIDLETILIAWLAAKIKGAKIHYDMADPFYLAKPIPGKKFWKFVEGIFVKFSFRVSAPHIKRLLLFANDIKSNMLVIENVPFMHQRISKDINENNKDYITLGYFGGLEANVRGLENIAQLVLEDNRFKLEVGGTGQLSLFFTELSEKCERVTYHGAFFSEDLPKLVKKVDVYIGYYSADKFLHTIAAPNKYYEHLYLGIPILTSCIIPQAEDIVQNNTGWCINDDKDSLQNWKNTIFQSKIDWDGYKRRCNNIWDSLYAEYYIQHKL